MKPTLIRSVLKIGAGVLVTKGVTDDSTAEVIVAGLTALISVLWGILDRGGKVPPAVPCLAMLAIAASLTGCATDPRAKAAESIESIRLVVERAENNYGRQCALGKISAADQAEVDKRILQFHAAFLVAVDAASADYASPAGPDLTRLAESLVALIYTFTDEPAP